MSAPQDIVDTRFAEAFAEEWIAAWNSHDMDRILSHYSDDFEMRSLSIISIAGEPSGVLQGKPRIRAYWERALTLLPNLKFELLGAYVGVLTIAIHYRNERGEAIVEILDFNSGGKAVRGCATREIVSQ